jgi:hypothetical protein
MVAELLNGTRVRTDFSAPPKLQMATRLRKKEDGLRWYGLMHLPGTELFMFDDTRAYKPSVKQFEDAVALCNKWNDELRKKRKL